MENTDQEKSAKTITLIIYGLYAAGILSFGLCTLVAFIINLVKKADVTDTLCKSHFRWQIRTVIFGFIFAVIGSLTTVFFVGIFILIGVGVWYIYRLVKGVLYLLDDKPMYQ